MQHLQHVDTVDEMRLIAVDIVSHYPGYSIIVLKGDLGAGKTTLSQLICEVLGVQEPVTSPTYTLVNEYHSTAGHTIYHFDLYRLKHPDELETIGFEEYLEKEAISLIEWPGLAEKYLLHYPYIEVNIYKPDEGRDIELVFHPLTT